MSVYIQKCTEEKINPLKKRRLQDEDEKNIFNWNDIGFNKQLQPNSIVDWVKAHPQTTTFGAKSIFSLDSGFNQYTVFTAKNGAKMTVFVYENNNDVIPFQAATNYTGVTIELMHGCYQDAQLVFRVDDYSYQHMIKMSGKKGKVCYMFKNDWRRRNELIRELTVYLVWITPHRHIEDLQTVSNKKECQNWMLSPCLHTYLF